MAAFYKGTLFFECVDFGWTETHYLVGADFTSAGVSLKAISNARMALSLNNVALKSARIVDATEPRVSNTPDRSTWIVLGTYNPAAGTTTVTPNLAILFRLYDATGGFRTHHYVRGFPANQFATGTGGPDALFTFTTDYSPLLTAYGDALKNNAIMAHKTAPHAFSGSSIDHYAPSLGAHLRRAGRPFDQPRGRRLIA